MASEQKELTLFEKIANKTIPSAIVYEDDVVCRRCLLLTSAVPLEM